MSHLILDGVPYINGKKAIYDATLDDDVMSDVLSSWRCPECQSRLSTRHLICLNACHLPAATYRRLLQQLGEHVS